VPSLVILLTKDFEIGFDSIRIAAPFAWWATADFLQQYQIRIEMPLWVFPIAG
jgi:hypothetical protein